MKRNILLSRNISKFIGVFLLFTLTSCSPTPASPAPTEANPPPSETPLPATEITIPTETIVPTPSPIPMERAQYTLFAILDYAAKKVDVEESILYPNKSGEALNDLLLAVESNYWPSGFVLHEIFVDEVPGNYTLEGQRLSIPLTTPLAPNQNIEIKLRYTLNLPFAAQSDPNESRPRIYGYTDRQVNLTNWYPFIVPNIAGEWVLHDPWFYGEHLVYDAVDYEVNFKTNDPTVVVAASAIAQTNADWTIYRLEAGRAFVLSASPEFQVERSTVKNITVSSYYFPFYEKPGKTVLDVSIKAIELYTEQYGPYPHASLTAVMGDFDDGMEYSAFYFLPNSFYNLFDGTSKNYLTFVAAHETAHQWWFETVASDQAIAPWLDESLSTYSEYLYYERYYPDLLNWWWPYRMYYYDSTAWMDIPLYEGGGFLPYTNATYFRGAYFLNDLRGRIGDEVFFAFLKDYRTQNAQKIGTGDDFFRILRKHTKVDFSDLTIKYFRAPH